MLQRYVADLFCICILQKYVEKNVSKVCYISTLLMWVPKACCKTMLYKYVAKVCWRYVGEVCWRHMLQRNVEVVCCRSIIPKFVVASFNVNWFKIISSIIYFPISKTMLCRNR